MNKEKKLLIVEGDKTEPKIMKQYAKVLNKTIKKSPKDSLSGNCHHQFIKYLYLSN